MTNSFVYLGLPPTERHKEQLRRIATSGLLPGLDQPVVMLDQMTPKGLAEVAAGVEDLRKIIPRTEASIGAYILGNTAGRSTASGFVAPLLLAEGVAKSGPDTAGRKLMHDLIATGGLDAVDQLLDYRVNLNNPLTDRLKRAIVAIVPHETGLQNPVSSLLTVRLKENPTELASILTSGDVRMKFTDQPLRNLIHHEAGHMLNMLLAYSPDPEIRKALLDFYTEGLSKMRPMYGPAGIIANMLNHEPFVLALKPRDLALLQVLANDPNPGRLDLQVIGGPIMRGVKAAAPDNPVEFAQDLMGRAGMVPGLGLYPHLKRKEAIADLVAMFIADKTGRYTPPQHPLVEAFYKHIVDRGVGKGFGGFVTPKMALGGAAAALAALAAPKIVEMFADR